MKLWTIVDLVRVPSIFSEGLTNPYYEEIIFHKTYEFIADSAMEAKAEEGPHYLPAFLQVDFPDDQLNEWFLPCMATNYDMLYDEQSSIEDRWEGGELTEEEYAEGLKQLELLSNALDSNDMATVFEIHDFACLAMVVPPEMIKILDPATMLEAVLSENQVAIMEAAEMADARGLESMGGSFWVWLIMFMAGLFGPNWSEQAEAEDAVRKGEARRRRRKGGGRKRAKKKRKTPRKRKKTMAGMFA